MFLISNEFSDFKIKVLVLTAPTSLSKISALCLSEITTLLFG
jgi:hypothetical protein